MTTRYQGFLGTKRLVTAPSGVTVSAESLPDALFPFQRAAVRWAIERGRAALFMTTGMGKTLCQLAWAEAAIAHSGPDGRALILAPLAVAQQTEREAARFGIAARYVRSQAEADTAAANGIRITITNYEMLHHFDATILNAVVLDESGILKDHTARTRTQLIETFRHTPFRLCCSATPAPNDVQELANHAEFLGIMSRVEMLAAFFIHDDEGWRLKGHATEPFYQWLASWSLSLVKPSDLGYDDTGFLLPPLTISPVIVRSDWKPDGQLFFTGLKGIGSRTAARKATIAERVAAAVRVIQSEPEEPWLVWCGLNDEAQALARALPGSVNVQGSDSHEQKADALLGFAEGRLPILITKPSIGAWGLNFQHCARMVFVGLGDSFEQYFQAIRRCWRFGQNRPVHASIVLSDVEEAVFENVLSKEREHEAMMAGLMRHVMLEQRRTVFSSDDARTTYTANVAVRLPSWCVSAAQALEGVTA